jgi:hypothetical protein
VHLPKFANHDALSPFHYPSSSQLFQAPSWPVQTPHSACSTPVQTLNSPRFALGGLPCLNPLPRSRTDYSTWGTMGCTPASPGQSQAEAYHGTINPSITTHQNGTGFLYNALYGKERPEPGADRHSLTIDYFVPPLQLERFTLR